MPSHQTDELLLAETAAAAGTTSERGQALLEILHRMLGFDGAWLALADPSGPGYHFLASIDVDASVVRISSGPVMAGDVEAIGTAPACPPLSPLYQPHAGQELQTWSKCLMRSEIHEALALTLFVPTGRHVGYLALLFEGPQPPSAATRRQLERLAPVIAHGIDPMRSLDVTARLARGATAGVVLLADGNCQALPSLPTDELLAPYSSVLSAARERLDEGEVCSTFLWPVGGAHAPGGHLRITALSAPEDVPPGLVGVVLLSPAPDLHGLTPRELEVVGLLVKGCSNQDIARMLVLAPRTVAAHLEHVLSKLEVTTRTLVAVRAAREGLYVPLGPLP